MEPTTNLGKYLAALAGEEVELPEPTNELEFYLKKIVDSKASDDGGNPAK